MGFTGQELLDELKKRRQGNNTSAGNLTNSSKSTYTGTQLLDKLYGRDAKAAIDAYNKAKEEAEARQKDYDEKMSYDLEAGKAELDRLNSILGTRSEISKLKSDIPILEMAVMKSDPTGANKAKLESAKSRLQALETTWAHAMKEYGSEKALESLLSEKNQYYTLAKRVQDGARLSGVSDPKSEYYDPDFEKYSTLGNNQWWENVGGETTDHKNAPNHNGLVIYDDLKAATLVMNERWLGTELFSESMLAPNPDAPTFGDMFNGASVYNSENIKTVDTFREMTDDDIAILAYYLQKDKDNGTNLAEQYIGSIRERLNLEMGKKIAAEKESLASKYLFAAQAGLEQFFEGRDALFSDADYIPTSSTQYASAILRESLADSGIPVWYNAKTGAWENTILGSSSGQIFYDALNTTSNMLPSVLTSAVVNYAAPGAGSYVGSALIGMSAAGNAKAEMLNLGYSKEQANSYGVMVGVSEAVLEKALGGIPGLKGGDGVFSSLGKRALGKIDNAFARVAITVGGNMLDEGLEEGLQTVIEPWLKEVATSVDWESANVDEVLYSSLLGAISSIGFSGAGMVGNRIQSDALVRKHGQDIIDNGGVDALKALALEMSGANQNKQGQKIANLARKAERKASAKNVGKLSTYMEGSITTQNEAPLTKALTQKGLSEKVATKVAKYIMDSNELSATDVATIEGSARIQEAMNEVLADSNLDISDSSLRLQGARQGIKASNASEVLTGMAEKASVAKSEADIKNEAGAKFEASESGKTIYKERDAKVKRIASTEGGLKVELESGETVNASDLSFSTKEEALMYEMVARMEVTPETANEIISTFKPSDFGQASRFFTTVPLAYTYGKMGYEAGLKNVALPDNLRKIVYNRGRMDAITQDKSKTSTKTAKKGGKATTKKGGIIFENGYVYDESKANDLQKASMVGIEAIQKMSNLEVHVYESKLVDGKRVAIVNGKKVTANGFFVEGGNKIYIDINAGNGGEGAMLYTMSHEVTHYIRNWNAKGFRELGDFLISEYGKQGVPVQALINEQKRKLKEGYARGGEAMPSEAQLADMAYEELVADAMSDMFADAKAYEKLAKLKQKNRTLWQKLGEAIKALLDKLKTALGVYKEKGASTTQEADFVRKFSQEVYEKLQDLYLKAFVQADANYAEAVPDSYVSPVEETTKYSYRSLAEAAGFEAIEDENGTRHFIRDGRAVSKVTIEDIENSPIGAFINYSLDKNDITEEQAQAQKKLFADICTIACETNDFSMTMQFVGSAVFTGMKANADKQYGTTYDFPSICTKTQAVIDAMSKRMVKLGRGLTREELVGVYQDVFASGNPVPCPECYVFSRWIGIGGLLDNIKTYQDYYGEMSVEEVAEAYKKMRSEVEAFAKEQGLSFGKAKGALTSKLTKEYNKLTEKIEKQVNQGEKVKDSDQKRLDELKPMMNTVKSMTWLENVYFADASLTKVNPRFRVPNEVLFDLNNGEAFTTKYPEAWAFRTTQGAGYGKAITPYAEASLGEGILVTNNTSNAIKGKANGTLNNYFLQQKGKMDDDARKALDRAREKQKNQAFLGGQRFQSTSDARYENAADYLLAALEMQAMHGAVQAYTKVDGAVPAFANWGFSINQSLMPLGGGLDADGNVKDTSVGGMSPKVAFANRKKFETAGTITIGANDNHIRAMFPSENRDFIIPYHASGGQADVVAAFRAIQEGETKSKTMVRSTDYSKTQSDKILSDEVLKWLGKSDAEIEQIHKVREARIGILTRGKVDMDVVRGNRFLSALYDKLHGGEWDGVKIPKSKFESQIYPNEFWDQTVTYEESGKITEDYLEYCDDLGFLHRFSGLIPRNGMLVPVNGYDQNGSRVQLTDLAYQANGEIEPYFWKTLTDRRMYDNDGNYLAQKYVTLSDTTPDTVTNFAKVNTGRQYDKNLSKQTAEKVASKKYSERDTSEAANTFVAHMRRVVENTGGWDVHEVFDYVKLNPDLNFIERILGKDKAVKKDLESFLAGIDDPNILQGFSWFMGEAYKRRAMRYGSSGRLSSPYQGAVRTFRNAIHNRINEIMTVKANGTNLGVKNGSVSLDEVKDLFDRLNSNADIGDLAEKVFATAKKLGVNIRFANQTFSKKAGGGDAWGDMVELKTSYFNNTAYTDQRKAQTILHELIHTCTVYVMNANRDFAGDVHYSSDKTLNYERISNAATRLNRIYLEIKDDPNFKGQYGIRNAKEMVAELANPEFVELLKKKTLWQQVLDWICELFGFRTGTNAYENAMACLDYILDNPEVSEYKAHALRVRQAAHSRYGEAFGSTVLPDGQVRYSERDSSYLDAVNRGDMETAQRMVDEAANKAMPNSILREGNAINKGEDADGTLVKMFHGSGAKGFHTFETHDGALGKGIYLTSNWDEAVGYAIDKLGIEESDDGYSYVWNGETYDGIGGIGDALESKGYVRAFYANVTDANDITTSSVYWADVIALVRDGKQLKSADPVTYDDDGNVIPLSERFNPGNSDIRYSERDSEAREFSDADIRYSIREEAPPKKTIEGYKVFVVKNGKLYPPMVANPNAEDTPVGVWLNADVGTRAPDSKTGRMQVKAGGKGTQGGSGSLAFRPGWHLGETPLATQFDRLNPETGAKELFPENFVWALCDIAADHDYQEEAMSYGYTKNGKFQHSLAGLPKLPADGYYKYRTNPNPDTVPWLITGAMKVKKLLSDAEVNAILKEKGLPAKQRVGGEKTLADLGLSGYEGIKFQERESTSVSNRTLLAGALESVAQNDIEKQKLGQYKAKIAQIESEQEKLKELREKANKLRFTKGRTAEETKKMRSLDDEATKIANRISTYDKQLLNLEATTALKNVLEREKENLRKNLEAKGRKAVSEQRKRDAKRAKEIVTHYQESRNKAIEGRNKTAMRHKIVKTLKRLNKLFKGGKERNVKEGMRDTVATALALGEILFNNNISNRDIVRLGVESVTEKESKLLNEYRDLLNKKEYNKERIEAIRAGEIKPTSRPYLAEVEESNRKIEARIAKLNKELSDVFERERTRLTRTEVSTLIYNLAMEYHSLQESKDDYIKRAYSADLFTKLIDLKKEMDGVTARDMSMAQLEKVDKVFTMVEHSVRTANQYFRDGKFEDLEMSASTIMGEVDRLEDTKQISPALAARMKSFLWNELTPYRAFDKIGSETLMTYFVDLLKGQAVAARDAKEAKLFAAQTRKKYGYSEWKLDEVYDFKLKDGRTFSTTLKHLLSVYAYSKREQAKDHMETGGFFHNDKATFRKVKGVLKMVRTDAVGYKVDADVLAEIKKALGAEKMGYVDEMLGYLTKIGEKGNEVARVMWGVDIFTEEVYFPLKSKDDFLKKSTETAQAVSLKNDGMTRETVPHASNPIVLEAFDDVWASHVERMSQYHGMVIPIDNLNKVLHYGKWAETDSVSVSTMLEGKFTSAATDYLEQLIDDLNGGVVSKGVTNPFWGFFSKWKKTKVGASLSTVVQQPTAILRAMAEIDPKYFVGKPNFTKLSEKWEEMQTYAPIAIIKEIGGFDAGSGKQMERWINSDTLTGIDKVADTIDNISMKGAEIADQIGWVAIWEAVKRETLATTDLEYGSEEFLERCGERAEEVINKTQVYDSVLSRSGFMRSKNDSVKMLTSFMGEPTLSMNMLYSAVINAKRGGKAEKAKAARTIGCVYASIILAEALAAAIYALRDDDEDESYAEKYLQAFGEGFLSDIVFAPVTSLPGVKDIVSVFQGWNVDRSDMAIFADIKNAFDGLGSDSKSGYRKVEDFAGAIAAAFGVPLKNVLRTGRELYNAYENIADGVTGMNGSNDFVDSITGNESSKSQDLYNAIVSGDNARLNIYKKGYKTADAYTSAVRKALRENDPRIHEAAQARYDGDISEYARIARLIVAEKHFSQDDVVAAINAELNAIKRGEATGSVETEAKDEVTSIYSASDINVAFASRDDALALEIIRDLIETKKANGMEEKSAKTSLRSSMTAYWKPLYKQAYSEGDVAEMLRIRKILLASGLYGSSSDVVATVRSWLKS